MFSPSIKSRSGITRQMLVKWGGEDVFAQAMELATAGDVMEVEFDAKTREISGKIVQGDGWAMPLKLQLLDDGNVKSFCPCRKNKLYSQVCEHVVALGLAVMVAEMDDVSAPSVPKEHSREQSPKTASASSAGVEDAQSCDDAPQYYEGDGEVLFSAYVSLSKHGIAIEIDASYGEIVIPACSLQSQELLHSRDMASEREAVKLVLAMGFRPSDKPAEMRYILEDRSKILDFFGTGLPELRRQAWKVDLSPRVMKMADSFPYAVPVVEIRDAPGAFDVAYHFDATGLDVPPAAIQGALNRNQGFVKLGEKNYVLLDTKAVKAMHAVFADCDARQDPSRPGVYRIPIVHAPYVKASLELLDSSIDLDDESARKWREVSSVASVTSASSRGEAKLERISLGPLEKILRPYQKQGVYWMRFLEEGGLCGLLADEMGLGKTLQTLTWLSLARIGLSRGERLPALVVCPTSLVRNWEAEAAKFIPSMKTLVVSGPDRAQIFPRIPEADLVITSYALLQRDFEAAYFDREFSAIVLDEAQHIKNRQTKNARAVKLIRSRTRLVLTGTPIENSVADVWSIFDFLQPGYLGDYETFRFTYEMPISEGGAAGESALSRLKRRLSPFILRREKRSVAKDLPEKIIKISYCPMSDEAQSEYLATLEKTRSEIGTMVREKGLERSRFDILARLMKLRRIASFGKEEAFFEQLEDAIAGGHRILVFSQFVKTLQLLAAGLGERNIPYCYLDGSTKDRLGECNRFNATASIPVFLISLMAGGTGLNLTGADMVIHYDPWWNPAVEDQATDRAHRIGQKRTVYVMKMIASHTIEEKVLGLQKRKQAVIASTISTTDTAIMEKLTLSDLEDLLR